MVHAFKGISQVLDNSFDHALISHTLPCGWIYGFATVQAKRTQVTTAGTAAAPNFEPIFYGLFGHFDLALGTTFVLHHGLVNYQFLARAVVMKKGLGKDI